MIDFEGESDHYCQYGYARGKGILRRAADIDYSDADISLATSDEEYALIKQINSFGEAVASAAEKNEPFYINRYVTNLTKAFNKFYNNHPIMKDDVDIEVKKEFFTTVENVFSSPNTLKSALPNTTP